MEEFSSSLSATNGRLLYLVCKQALRKAGVKYTHDDPGAILVWCDTVKIEYFHQMHPWQVINRLPWAKVMCRKAPFVRLIHRIASFYPDLYSFLPKSYILPADRDEFDRAVKRHDRVHIYKPDRGSLGRGIELIEKEDEWEPQARLAVAQEYIDSYTIDNRKFDLRLYALIASMEPLRIYVYRRGLARFCTDSAGASTKYARITNTAVNSKNPEAKVDEMTQTLTDIFPKLKEQQVDIEKLWDNIDSAIVLTIISAYGFLAKAAARECPDVGYPRCFQIIGCDVLLDRHLKPYVLEINYRPSLKCNNDKSHDLKLSMLQDAIKLGCPYQPLQELIRTSEEIPTDLREFRQFLQENGSVLRECDRMRELNQEGNTFAKVFPNPTKPVWNQVLERVLRLPTETEIYSSIPRSIDKDDDEGSE
jgi:hypothetical protein